MDTLASLALATEAPTDDLLLRKPVHKDANIVSTKMSKHIFGQSILQFIVVNIFFFVGPQFLPEEMDDNQKRPGSKSPIANYQPTSFVPDSKSTDTTSSRRVNTPDTPLTTSMFS